MLNSLRSRLVLTYTGLTLLAVGALALYIVGSLEDLLLRRLADDLRSQAHLVADHVSEDLAAGRLDAVRDRIARIDTITDARAIAVDARRRVVGASEADDRVALGAVRDDVGLREALRGESSSILLPATQTGEVLYVAEPIRHNGQIVGALRLAYNVVDVQGTIQKVNLTVALGALGAVLLAALISVGFARAVGNPIQELRRAAQALAAGDLSPRLTKGSKDEVGQLVDAFNVMAARLREADRARREFASDVSHELHSLASAMQTAAEALALGADRDESLRARLVGGLVGHTHRLNRLSEDLLQLARLEGGRLSLEIERCSLAEVVRRTVDEFAAEAAQQGLELSQTASGDLPLEADEVRLVQAVGNLVENAVKYTPRGGHVSVSAEAVNGDYCVRVVDNGRGIPPAELPHIWDRYYRVEGRASDGSAGTGLGLAIAAGIVQAHGGRIDVESAPERGTTFTIRLPRQRAPIPSPL